MERPTFARVESAELMKLVFVLKTGSHHIPARSEKRVFFTAAAIAAMGNIDCCMPAAGP